MSYENSYSPLVRQNRLCCLYRVCDDFCHRARKLGRVNKGNSTHDLHSNTLEGSNRQCMKAYCSIISRDWRGVRRLRMHGILAIPPPCHTDPIISATRVASKKMGVRQQRSTRLWMSAGCPTFPPLCSPFCSFSPYHPHFSVVPIYTLSICPVVQRAGS